MPTVKVKLDKDFLQRLNASKALYDYIMDEDPELTDWDIYIATLLWRAIKAMIEDVTPSDNPVLQRTLLNMHEQEPEFVSRFIIDTLKTGEDVLGKEEAKRRLGFIKNSS